ncbi:UNVERIFIED_CONTAM: hypothetical protein Slati_2456600, partial [Sesamum latifolium]
SCQLDPVVQKRPHEHRNSGGDGFIPDLRETILRNIVISDRFPSCSNREITIFRKSPVQGIRFLFIGISKMMSMMFEGRSCCSLSMFQIMSSAYDKWETLVLHFAWTLSPINLSGMKPLCDRDIIEDICGKGKSNSASSTGLPFALRRFS